MRHYYCGAKTCNALKINSQVESEINSCVQALRKKELIFFPGETGWSIGCDMTEHQLVEEILSVDQFQYPTVMLYDTGRLHKFVKEIPDTLHDLVEFSVKPIDFYLQDVVNVPSLIKNENGETSFRIPKDEFTQQLLYKSGKAIFSVLIPGELRENSNLKAILNTPVYMVNLRISSRANSESLVIIRMTAGGRIEFIKK